MCDCVNESLCECLLRAYICESAFNNIFLHKYTYILSQQRRFTQLSTLVEHKRESTTSCGLLLGSWGVKLGTADTSEH